MSSHSCPNLSSHPTGLLYRSSTKPVKLPGGTTTSQEGWLWCGPPTTRAASALTRAASTSGTPCRTWSPPGPTPRPSLLTSQCNILFGKVCLVPEGNLPFSLFFLAWFISGVAEATKENLCEIARSETLVCDMVYEHQQDAGFLGFFSHYSHKNSLQQKPFPSLLGAVHVLPAWNDPLLFLFLPRPTERERTERLIKAKLRSIMTSKDLENVTSKEVNIKNSHSCSFCQTPSLESGEQAPCAWVSLALECAFRSLWKGSALLHLPLEKSG